MVHFIRGMQKFKNENIEKTSFGLVTPWLILWNFIKKILDDQSFKNYKRKDYVLLTYHRDFNDKKINY